MSEILELPLLAIANEFLVVKTQDVSFANAPEQGTFGQLRGLAGEQGHEDNSFQRGFGFGRRFWS